MARRGMVRGLRAAPAAAAALLLVCAPFGALAGTTGKLAGHILDKRQQPLVGVNVVIPAARLGTATDPDGRYAILNIPAGIYEVKVSLLGYNPVAVQQVVVSADNTTALDLALEEAPLLMKEIVVTAKRPVVDLRLTSNLAAVDREKLKALPVQELQDVVNLQAGVVDGHFRGGRIGEVQFQVDGVTVNNAYDNKSSLRLDRSLIEEVQVISGTFDAEYGQAMSGVVNAVLRRGTDQLRWDAEVLEGGFLYTGGARRVVPLDFRPAGQQNYQLSLSGPAVLPKTFYLLSGRRFVSDDYTTATRRFTPWQTPSGSPWEKIRGPDGDSLREPLGYSREWSGVAKVTNRSLRDIELNYQALFNVLDGRRATWAWRLDPDGLSKQRTVSVAHGLDWTHTLSKTTYYNVSLRQNLFDYRDMVYESVFDPRYDRAGPPRRYAGYEHDAYVQGVDFTRFRQNTDAIVLKSTFASQRTRDQLVKAGAEFQWARVKFGTPGVLAYVSDSLGQHLQRYVNVLPKYPDVLLWRPYTAAAFAQEEVEWNDLRLRAGLRLDYFNSRAGVPEDLANPANSIAGAPQSRLRPASRKVSLSPRIGVSYPVTRDAALFFAYGHFSQMPPIGEVFRNADYGLLYDLQAGEPIDRHPTMGNPDIRPERTVQYQFGYKQALADWLGLDVTAFYKDVRGLLGVEIISTYNGALYTRLTNVDFGNVIGFTLALDQRQRGLVSSSLDYTWQLAQGNSSDPYETATRAAANEDPRPRVIPFIWDQRHTLNMTVMLSHPDDFSAAAVVRVASGQPYTPAIEQGDLEANSGRKPASMLVDLRSEKILRWGGLPVSAFGRVFNLFDTRFFNGSVFNTSGSPYYSRFPGPDGNTLADPTRYYQPRRVEIGVTLRSEQ